MFLSPIEDPYCIFPFLLVRSAKKVSFIGMVEALTLRFSSHLAYWAMRCLFSFLCPSFLFAGTQNSVFSSSVVGFSLGFLFLTFFFLPTERASFSQSGNWNFLDGNFLALSPLS